MFVVSEFSSVLVVIVWRFLTSFFKILSDCVQHGDVFTSLPTAATRILNDAAAIVFALSRVC